jgi:predicted short-subunit dehydrogenase-like oxidoreductase (DUF2520 family)
MTSQRIIALIGAGKIGYSLTAALHDAALRVSAVISKTRKYAEELGGQFAIPVVSDSVSDLPSKCSHIIIAVPDSAIEPVAKDLAAREETLAGKTVLHLSGAETIVALQPLADRGALTASLHIMQSFPSREFVPVKGCAAAIETDDTGVYEDLRSLALQLQMKPFKIQSSDKARYHLAGVYAANFLVGNLYAAEKIFSSLDVHGISFFDVVMPIIYQTLENIELFGVTSALSGPVERGARDIINRHLTSLANGSEELRELIPDYRAKTIQLIRAAREKNPNLSSIYDELERGLC